jgi:2-methylisocitrate lyase-like PEP mutase family enzyme
MTVKSELFRSLHVAGTPLRLPNAWDVASARIIEDAGAQAIATTSAGVAWSLGLPDGDKLDPDRTLDVVARIVETVGIPVTADIESGSDSVGDLVAGIWDAGAVGVNIEDGARPPEDLVSRIKVAKDAAPELFVNARIDTFLFQLGDPDTRLRTTLDRAAAYLAAGADGIFVPGVIDHETIAALAKGIAAPLNTMAGRGAPPVDEQAALGVARVSLGSAIAQSAYSIARDAATELLTTGTYNSLAPTPLDYTHLNTLLT